MHSAHSLILMDVVFCLKITFYGMYREIFQSEKEGKAVCHLLSILFSNKFLVSQQCVQAVDELLFKETGMFMANMAVR